jgi:phosphonopyruvate decarboxylase
MGWRGEPGGKDEPQHKKMGKITEKILTGLGVPYEILDENNYKNKINDILTLSKSEQQPCALIIRPGFFSAHDSNKEVKVRGVATMMREDAIKSVVHAIQDNNVILSTTGKTSRELYEVCEVNQRGHNNNFYNVGSMGHVSAIGLEVALQQKEKLIFILDGDGSVIMHMGTLAAIGRYHPTNLVHIVFDNEAHESTGGQPTLSKGIDIAGIMSKCNYKKVETVDNEAAINRLLSSPISGPLGIVVKIRAGSRNDLGRPTNSPKETKIRFMNWHDC